MKNRGHTFVCILNFFDKKKIPSAENHRGLTTKHLRLQRDGVVFRGVMREIKSTAAEMQTSGRR